MDAWQTQATATQQELDGALKEAAALRTRVAALEAAVRQAEEGSARLQVALDQVRPRPGTSDGVRHTAP